MWAMEALAVSTLTVAVAEIGDKTQLLALLLAARYRRPWPIVAGILVATLLNHALAGWLGALAASWLTPDVLRWAVAASFIAIALWTLKPDQLEDDALAKPARGPFLATHVAFSLPETGDKTKVATALRGELHRDRAVDAEAGQARGRRARETGARRVRRHLRRLLHRRNRRQDPGRDGAAGRALRAAVAGRGRHHRRHARGQHPRGAAGQ